MGSGDPDGGDDNDGSGQALDLPPIVVIVPPDGGTTCKPRICSPAGGRYCGSFSDDCGGMLNCGNCPSGQACGTGGSAHVCISADPNCMPLTCMQGTQRFCGDIGDGCGRPLGCGATCPAGQTCTKNLCVPTNCTPITCNAAGGGKYCGTIGNGCGGVLECGGCAAGQNCASSICTTPPDPNCVPVACNPIGGGKYCGTIGNGCGGVLECGGCPNNDTCCADGICPGGATCTNLCLKQTKCLGGDTTVSGIVLAPTPPRFGTPDPIYNAIVYVPNGTVLPFAPGVSCDKCGALATGSPLVTTVTGPDGKFVLKNVPVGDNIPLVIQVGRWRRQVVIPKVTACTDTPLPAEMTRLPRNKTEGDIPLTVIATGRADAIECVLRKIGVDDSEFTLPSGNGRIQIYSGSGATLGAGTPQLSSLVGNLNNLKKYDMVILECQGTELTRSAMQKQNVVQYADAGGRLFITHYGYDWMYTNPPFQGTATWFPAGGPPKPRVDPTPGNAPLTGIIDQSFPKGIAFAQWLQNVKATKPVPGQIEIEAPRHDLDAVIAPAQRWIYSTAPTATVQHFTFNTPIGTPVENQCGRALYSDFHVNSLNGGATNIPFPMECGADEPLSAQEKVLEFMLFDLASCVQPDTAPPMPPMPPVATTPPPIPPAPPPTVPPAPPEPPPAPIP